MEAMNPTFGDCEMTADALATQKQLAVLYNAATCESTEASLMTALMTILGETHKLRLELSTELQKRGWSCPAAADPQRLQHLREQFDSTNS